MNGKRSEGRKLVDKYCSLKKYKDYKDYTLSKYIFEHHKDMFKSREQVRKLICTERGHKGNEARLRNIDKSNFKPLTYDTTNMPKPYKSEEVYAKILVLDIETAPLLANIWGIWNQNIQTDNIHSDWFMLTWAAKWLFENKIYSARVTPKEAKDNNDKRIVKSLIGLLNEADIVVTHNGNKFDLPRINTRAIIHRLNPPLPYVSIDTLQVAKRSFAFTSNKLDYINKVLGLKQKSETTMELWRDCFHGKEEGLKKMERYNINDVRIHETTYLTMRPYIKSHPNIGLHIIDEHERCPSCGSKEINVTGKPYATGVNLYDTFRCNNCGSVGKKKKTLPKSKHLTSSVSR